MAYTETALSSSKVYTGTPVADFFGIFGDNDRV